MSHYRLSVLGSISYVLKLQEFGGILFRLEKSV